MRTILSVAAAIAMVWLGVAGAQQAQQKKAAPAANKSAAKKAAATPAKKGPAHTAGTAHGKKAAPRKPVTTWRNRQLAPSADRYREIQSALVAKGYLQDQDATGVWNQASMDALKQFQAQQNLEATGKINSLSLIALGLGPKREPNPVVPKPTVEHVPGQ